MCGKSFERNVYREHCLESNGRSNPIIHSSLPTMALAHISFGHLAMPAPPASLRLLRFLPNHQSTPIEPPTSPLPPFEPPISSVARFSKEHCFGVNIGHHVLERIGLRSSSSPLACFWASIRSGLYLSRFQSRLCCRPSRVVL